MAKPIAVLISDVHFSLQTLDLATKAMEAAIKTARKLNVQLVVAGDLHDTKANLRGECVNRLIQLNQKSQLAWWILIGNHDKINEKSEDHSLNFLSMHSHIVEKPKYVECIDSYLIPYQHDLTTLKSILDGIPKGSRLIMHQGLQSALPGEYTMDKTAAPMEWFAEYRVISGHYHARQDVNCGRPQKGAVGLFSYIGNPYTVSFGEANDPEKGFQVLYDDGTLVFTPIELRKHVVIETDASFNSEISVKTNDLVWLKVKGTREELKRFKRPNINNLRLDLIPTDEVQQVEVSKELTDSDILDKVIANLSEIDNNKKTKLKSLWRELT